MRWRVLLISAVIFALGGRGIFADEAKVRKVLVQLLDAKGRNALHPSLFDRDAYQAYLRKHPKEQSGVRFFVEWTAEKAHQKGLLLRIEIRGIRAAEEGSKTRDFKTLSLETPIIRRGWYGTWTTLTLDEERFRAFGEIVAWHATIWDGVRMVAEQKSFLW